MSKSYLIKILFASIIFLFFISIANAELFEIEFTIDFQLIKNCHYKACAGECAHERGPFEDILWRGNINVTPKAGFIDGRGGESVDCWINYHDDNHIIFHVWKKETCSAQSEYPRQFPGNLFRTDQENILYCSVGARGSRYTFLGVINKNYDKQLNKIKNFLFNLNNAFADALLSTLMNVGRSVILGSFVYFDGIGIDLIEKNIKPIKDISTINFYFGLFKKIVNAVKNFVSGVLNILGFEEGYYVGLKIDRFGVIINKTYDKNLSKTANFLFNLSEALADVLLPAWTNIAIRSTTPGVIVYFSTDGIERKASATNPSEKIYACLDVNENDVCDFIDAKECLDAGGDFYPYRQDKKIYCCKDNCSQAPFGFCGQEGDKWRWLTLEDIGQIANFTASDCFGASFLSNGTNFFACGDKRDLKENPMWALDVVNETALTGIVVSPCPTGYSDMGHNLCSKYEKVNSGENVVTDVNTVWNSENCPKNYYLIKTYAYSSWPPLVRKLCAKKEPITQNTLFISNLILTWYCPGGYISKTFTKNNHICIKYKKPEPKLLQIFPNFTAPETLSFEIVNEITNVTKGELTHDFACTGNKIYECRGDEEPISLTGIRASKGKAILPNFFEQKFFSSFETNLADENWSVSGLGTAIPTSGINKTGLKGLNMSGNVRIERNLIDVANKTIKMEIWGKRIGEQANSFNLTIWSSEQLLASEILELGAGWANKKIEALIPGSEATLRIELSNGTAALDDVAIEIWPYPPPISWCAKDGAWLVGLLDRDKDSCENALKLNGESGGFKWTGHACCGEELNEYYNEFSIDYDFTDASLVTTNGTVVDRQKSFIIVRSPGDITLNPTNRSVRLLEEWFSEKDDGVECAKYKSNFIELYPGKSIRISIPESAESIPVNETCVKRKVKISFYPEQIIGACYNSAIVYSGDLLFNDTVLIYRGEFFGCQLPENATILNLKDKFTNQSLILNKPACGPTYINISEATPNLHAICQPWGKWQTLINPTPAPTTKPSSILWEPTGYELNETGCCPENMCWDGNTCVPLGTYYGPLGRKGYKCVLE